MSEPTKIKCGSQVRRWRAVTAAGVVDANSTLYPLPGAVKRSEHT